MPLGERRAVSAAKGLSRANVPSRCRLAHTELTWPPTRGVSRARCQTPRVCQGKACRVDADRSTRSAPPPGREHCTRARRPTSPAGDRRRPRPLSGRGGRGARGRAASTSRRRRRSGAVGLAVPGAGPTVTRSSALNTLLTGGVESSILGGTPTGRPKLTLGGAEPPDVLVTLPPPGRTTNDRRYPIAVIGSGARGVLTSDSTRIVGPRLARRRRERRPSLGRGRRPRGDARAARPADRAERPTSACRSRSPSSSSRRSSAGASRAGALAWRCSRSPRTCGWPAGGSSRSPPSLRSRCRSAPRALRSSSPTSQCSGSTRRRSRCHRSARRRPGASTASRTCSPPGSSSPRCSARRCFAGRESPSPPSHS